MRTPVLLFAVMLAGCGGMTTGSEPDAGADAPPADAPDAPGTKSETGPTCSGEGGPCTRREDCCNSRHSCFSVGCYYSESSVPLPRVTFEADVQPLLLAKCMHCHNHPDDPSQPAPFVSSYAITQQPSKLCSGARVGECINRALQVQVPEGEWCRTVVMPFHREGWTCLNAAEINLVAAWVAGGMIER